MKRLVCFFITLVLFLPAHSSALCQPGDNIPLHENVPPGDNPHAPALVPISCYLMPSSSSVLLYSASITTTAHVELENLTTGLTYSCDILISSIPVPLSLLGPGDYTIEITLPSGIVYSGSFYFSN